MGIDSINSSMNSTPSIDVSLGSFTQQNSDQRGGRQSFSTALANTAVDSVKLSSEAQDAVRKLQARDREVRTHEQAHIAAAGGYAQGGANYTYTKGPDNKMYATGGSVSLDVSPIPGDPEATEKKARTLRAAALAPANPSAQDQSVAAQASAMATQAQIEARKEKQEGAESTGNGASGEVNSTSGTNGALQPYAAQGNDDAASSGRVRGRGAIVSSDSTADTVPAGASSQFTNSASHIAFFRDSSLTIVSSSDSMFFVNQGSVGFASSAALPSEAYTERAHTAYRTQQQNFAMHTALAPAGTGIDMHI